MVNLIKKFFDKGVPDKSLVKEDIARNIKLAACVVLLEVAFSDEEFADEERKFVVDVLRKDYDLTDAEAGELIEIGTKILQDDTNKWRYMNVINENFSNEDKIRFIENIWKLIYADERLDRYENHIVHKLSSVFHIPHKDLIQAKLRVLDTKEQS